MDKEFDIDKVESKVCVYCCERYHGLKGDNSGGVFDYQKYILRTVCTNCGAPLCKSEDRLNKPIRIGLKHNSKFEFVIHPDSGSRSPKMVWESFNDLFRKSELLFKIEDDNLILFSPYTTEPDNEWHILDKKTIKDIIFDEIDLFWEIWYEKHDVPGFERVYLTKKEKMFHIRICAKDIRIKRKVLLSFLKARPNSKYIREIV